MNNQTSQITQPDTNPVVKPAPQEVHPGTEKLTTINNKKEHDPSWRTTVRFTRTEYDRIRQDALIAGETRTGEEGVSAFMT
jgi:hypothetical protein